MKLLKNTKRGSYLVEATLIVPIFIVALLLIMSIVDVVRISENLDYSVCDEVERLQAEAIYKPIAVGVEKRIIKRAKEENQIKSFYVDTFRYRYITLTRRDLIRLSYRAVLNKSSILGITEGIECSGVIFARGFTGTTRTRHNAENKEFTKNEDYIEVFIFPQSGKKYHKHSCSYVNSKPYSTQLTKDIKDKYTPCKTCGANRALEGELVFCFPHGHSYHLVHCKTIDKYVIAMDKSDAIAKGYSPCLKCGGS